MCVLCVCDMYIQQCRHAPEHTHIHILMQTLLYVEVWNIMVCNQNVPDANKHEQTPDVVRERLWRLLDSWEHIVDKREKCRHSHAHMHADTRTHTCMHTDTWHLRTHTHTRRRIHARADTHKHTHADTYTYTRTHTYQDKIARTHTHARTHTQDTHACAHQHALADTHMKRAEGSTPPLVCQPGKGGDSGGWAEGREKRGGVGYIESISAHTVITTTENSRHDVQSRCMRNDEGCA